ncbi:MAG: LppP/LprE family lipoprotein [Burkholderiales bacterium]|nr:LppP/LprE family lipoprotein [Burkholderiales bacterium]
MWAQRIARNQVRQAPSYHYPKLTLFLDAGRNYRTLTTDLDGQTERLSVKGSAITVDTLTLGPNDPRCCPTRKTQMHFRWQGGKLVALR